MNCDLENSFLLVYFSGPLIITHGHRGAAPADPLSQYPYIHTGRTQLPVLRDITLCKVIGDRDQYSNKSAVPLLFFV
jgi:hypothetical protein